MIIIEANKTVLMTPDKKCILRGSGNDKRLYLLEEHSRQKVTLYKSRKVAESVRNGAYIFMSDEARKFYNCSDYRYDSIKFGELVAVDVDVSLDIKD